MAIRDEARRQWAKINFPALCVLSVLAVIWVGLSPLWLPVTVWLMSILEPAVWFLCQIFLGVALVLMLGVAAAAAVLLLSGSIPKSL
jgi:hypothetical protein